MKPSRTVQIVLWLAQHLETGRSRLAHLAVRLDKRSVTKDLLTSLSENPGDFLSAPERLANSLVGNDQELKEVVRLYFLTKQVLSHYEAQLSTLPLQIFNEMRNALDHYLRAIIIPPGPESDPQRRPAHIKKMVSHLQRALLDGVKLTCGAMNERIEQTHRRVGEGAISLTKDGSYIKEITALQVAAERCLVNAKLKEYILGSDDANLEVQKCYLDALAAHSVAYKYFQDSLPSLRWSRTRYWLFKPRTLLLAVVSAAVGNYLGRAAWFTTEDLPLLNAVKDVITNWYAK